MAHSREDGNGQDSPGRMLAAQGFGRASDTKLLAVVLGAGGGGRGGGGGGRGGRPGTR
ncbi:MAG: hypothetical protein KJ686_04105 [Actinobacteria bacterium]|nr:hypothetical protein [Actinomycetota bacterium]